MGAIGVQSPRVVGRRRIWRHLRLEEQAGSELESEETPSPGRDGTGPDREVWPHAAIMAHVLFATRRPGRPSERARGRTGVRKQEGSRRLTALKLGDRIVLRSRL
jgi:hypothetical protein